jgi:hypothetical protein
MTSDNPTIFLNILAVLGPKVHKALKERGLNPNNVEWFADAIETGAIKIPEIQKQYAKVKDELEAIDLNMAEFSDESIGKTSIGLTIFKYRSNMTTRLCTWTINYRYRCR